MARNSRELAAAVTLWVTDEMLMKIIGQLDHHGIEIPLSIRAAEVARA